MPASTRAHRRTGPAWNHRRYRAPRRLFAAAKEAGALFVHAGALAFTPRCAIAFWGCWRSISRARAALNKSLRAGRGGRPKSTHKHCHDASKLRRRHGFKNHSGLIDRYRPVEHARCKASSELRGSLP